MKSSAFFLFIIIACQQSLKYSVYACKPSPVQPKYECKDDMALRPDNQSKGTKIVSQGVILAARKFLTLASDTACKYLLFFSSEQ